MLQLPSDIKDFKRYTELYMKKDNLNEKEQREIERLQIKLSGFIILGRNPWEILIKIMKEYNKFEGNEELSSNDKEFITSILEEFKLIYDME